MVALNTFSISSTAAVGLLLLGATSILNNGVAAAPATSAVYNLLLKTSYSLCPIDGKEADCKTRFGALYISEEFGKCENVATQDKKGTQALSLSSSGVTCRLSAKTDCSCPKPEDCVKLDAPEFDDLSKDKIPAEKGKAGWVRSIQCSRK